MPNTTVFFRFSHRDEHKEVLDIEHQKEKVKEVIASIMHNRAKYQAALIDDVLKYGPKPLTSLRSKTHLNYFDSYFSVP